MRDLPSPTSSGNTTRRETHPIEVVDTTSFVAPPPLPQTIQGNGPLSSKKTAFVHKLYGMLTDPTLTNLIWWSRPDDDCVFALHPGTEFASALTKYFKHGNVSSFVRQLHMYGFHKVFDLSENNTSSGKGKKNEDLIWEFRHSNGYFRKGDEAGLNMIKRRSSNKSVVPEDEMMRSVSPTSTVSSSNMSTSISYHPQTYVPPHPYTPLIICQAPPPPPPPFQPHQHYYIQAPPPPPVSAPLPTSASGIAPDLHRTTAEIAQQQQVMAEKSDHLHYGVRATVSDVLKLGDTIPRLVSVLAQASTNNIADLRHIHKSFGQRAESCKMQPQPVATATTPAVSQQAPQQQQYIQRANPFLASAQQRHESIHFWESSHNNNSRQGSFLVDPLNSSPRVSASSVSHHPNSTQSSMSSAGSLPHLYQSSMNASEKRESLNSYLHQISPNSHHPQQQQQPPPPRSIPEHYTNKSSSSIPNIAHLTSQLRPSVIEMANNGNSSVPTSNINSLSSTASSAHHTLYSSHSSVSSISSRGSYGSFSGFLPTDHHHQHKVMRHNSGVDPRRPLTKVPSTASISDLITEHSDIELEEQAIQRQREIGMAMNMNGSGASIKTVIPDTTTTSKLSVNSLLSVSTSSEKKRTTAIEDDAVVESAKRTKR